MNRLRFLMLALVCAIVPASTVRSAPVPAARSGLEQVPATAPVVIHLRGVQGIHDRLVDLMKKALPDLLQKYQTQIDDFFEKGPDNVLKNRKLKGLPKDGPIFFALLDLPKVNDPGEPKMAIIFAVSDYKEFRENILTEEERKSVKDEGNGIESANIESAGKPTYFVKGKGYAIVTPDKEVAESFTKKITGLHTKLNKDLAAKLLAADLGVYVNMEDVNKEYGEQIKQAKQGIDQAIAFGVAAAGDESQKKFAEMAKNAIPHIFQTIEDMQSLLLTFELRTGGLAVHAQSEMKDGSPTANLLQDARPIDFAELARLPRDRAYYLGMKASAALMKNLGSFISSVPTGGTKDSADLLKEFATAGPSLLLSSGAFPSAGLDVFHFDNPAKAVTATLKMYENMNPEDAKLKEKPKVTKDAEKFGDFKLHSIQVTMDLEKMAEDVAAKQGEDAKKEFIESMKRLLGGEKRTIWVGTDGKAFVSITAPDWKTASKMLEEYSKGAGAAGEVKAFRDVRQEMPKQTSALALIEAVHLFKGVYDAFKPLIPPGQLPPGWPNLKGKSTAAYLGAALTLQPSRGGVDLFITAAAAQEFYKTVIQPLVGE
jgi:hypothetical protein